MPTFKRIAEFPRPHDQRLAAPGNGRQRQLRAGVASLRNSGIGLISVFIGEKPETIRPFTVTGNTRAAIAFGRRRAFNRRKRVALGERLDA